ncbi:MAG: hypothetical protein IPN85_12990 [Flavobacteriales bacterium]|nr:hypothetical protein [Flavobacteriales bacterium]
MEVKQAADRRKMTFVLSNEEGIEYFTFSNGQSDAQLRPGLNHLICTFPKGFLNVGGYHLSFFLIEDNARTVFREDDILAFHIQEGRRAVGSWLGREPGFIKPRFQWSHAQE